MNITNFCNPGRKTQNIVFEPDDFYKKDSYKNT